ncbi:CDP-glycerol glycerophosphotransferase family protein [Phocicoccus pinnipedialis]|uniref:CDP-glycerol:poly(Glycerophosphate) glycerophosphotransferase n=1 Tax=Phocicoccus pinnipedialis TaxID=110845 RepID=A0A6V7R6Y1_9BACL|nr:CDP-glycerol glycerophosphotransferase family protein [Jeotgalicoccus pinnipedialis]MBP1938962.1 CDP-glycerol glycerophosphotransferase [Jeotgalicoccus pinnipedialis]CAD2073199.1 CDP-glycerol:poly(glycerophosphate) glycerophosphotransferase [Jeotgalicoccus pinnipedialis]
MKNIKAILLKIYKIIFILAGKVLPKNEKLIVLESFLGKQFSDNPRALYEYMKNRYGNEYELVWSVDRRYVDVFEENNVRYLKRFSLKWLLTLNRAKLWISNSRMPLWIPKPRKTKYLQTWHGTPLKRLALDMDAVLMPGTDTESYKKNFTTESSKWDYLISPNPYSTEIFRRAFNFNKTMLETGYPRNDILVNSNNEEYINKLKIDMGIRRDKKIILYAPTWRDNEYYQRGKYKLDIKLDLERMRESLSDDYVILLRMHYLIAENIDTSKYDGFVIDMSKYEDIRDLYLISDILLTDYSSVFFDYAILNRPVLFFTYDLESYRDNLRGFYFDFEKEAPGPLLYDTAEIIEQVHLIENGEFEFSERLAEFRKVYCSLEDGAASKRVMNRVL